MPPKPVHKIGKPIHKVHLGGKRQSVHIPLVMAERGAKPTITFSKNGRSVTVKLPPNPKTAKKTKPKSTRVTKKKKKMPARRKKRMPKPRGTGKRKSSAPKRRKSTGKGAAKKRRTAARPKPVPRPSEARIKQLREAGRRRATGKGFQLELPRIKHKGHWITSLRNEYMREMGAIGMRGPEIREILTELDDIVERRIPVNRIRIAKAPDRILPDGRVIRGKYFIQKSGKITAGGIEWVNVHTVEHGKKEHTYKITMPKGKAPKGFTRRIEYQ